MVSMMTNSDREGRIFLSHPHTNNGLFFLHTINKLFSSLNIHPRAPENAGI